MTAAARRRRLTIAKDEDGVVLLSSAEVRMVALHSTRGEVSVKFIVTIKSHGKGRPTPAWSVRRPSGVYWNSHWRRCARTRPFYEVLGRVKNPNVLVTKRGRDDGVPSRRCVRQVVCRNHIARARYRIARCRSEGRRLPVQAATAEVPAIAVFRRLQTSPFHGPSRTRRRRGGSLDCLF